jgi:hypothetical protein
VRPRGPRGLRGAGAAPVRAGGPGPARVAPLSGPAGLVCRSWRCARRWCLSAVILFLRRVVLAGGPAVLLARPQAWPSRSSTRQSSSLSITDASECGAFCLSQGRRPSRRRREAVKAGGGAGAGSPSCIPTSGATLVASFTSVWNTFVLCRLYPPQLHRSTPDRSPALPGHVMRC